MIYVTKTFSVNSFLIILETRFYPPGKKVAVKKITKEKGKILGP